MFHISNFTNNDDINVLDSMGPFTVIEYARDLSVAPTNAMAAYFCNAMNVRKRQIMCDLSPGECDGSVRGHAVDGIRQYGLAMDPGGHRLLPALFPGGKAGPPPSPS